MNINSLNTDTFRVIFRNLSIRELIHLRLICLHWKHLIESIFLEECQTLKLFDSQFDLLRYQENITNHQVNEQTDFGIAPTGSPVHDALILKPEQIHEACQTLPHLFPNVTNLVICSKTAVECQSFAEMLQHFSKLVNFTLLVRMQRISPQVLSSIDSLTNLRGLHLAELFQCEIPDEMRVLSQLERFTCVHYRADVENVLRQLGPTCRELFICWVYLTPDQLTRLLQIKPHLANNLSRLWLGFIAHSNGNRMKNYHKLFKLICTRFQSLKSLSILFADHMTLQKLIPNLFKLKNLTELQFYLSPNEISESDPNLVYNLPILVNVKILKLEIHNISIDTFVHYIAHLFPSIEQLTVKCYEFEDNEAIRETFRGKILVAFVYLIKLKLL